MDDILVYIVSKHPLKIFCMVVLLGALLGVPWNIKKLKPPTPRAIFAGHQIVIGKVETLVKVPENKLLELENLLFSILRAKKVSLDLIRTLTGKLIFMTTTQPALRTKLERMYAKIQMMEKMQLRSSLVGKGEFLNSLIFWYRTVKFDREMLQLAIQDRAVGTSQCIVMSDASTVAITALVTDTVRFRWTRVNVDDLQKAFPEALKCKRLCEKMVLLELCAILLGENLANNEEFSQRRTLYSDSEAAVKAVRKRHSKKHFIKRVLSGLTNSWDKIVFVPGHENQVADRLSRDFNFRPIGEVTTDIDLFQSALSKQ